MTSGKIGSLTDREFNKFTQSSDGQPVVRTSIFNKLVPEEYDRIDLGYSGSDIISVTYKLTGSTVAELSLTYSGSNLVSVERV